MDTGYNNTSGMNPIDWLHFFPYKENVIALPNWKTPRILLCVKDLDILNMFIEKIFNACRWKTKIYKYGLVRWAKTGKKFLTKKNNFNTYAIKYIVKNLDYLKVNSIAIIPGRPTPIQKIKILLLDNSKYIAGYIKFSYLKLAQKRLKQEYEILSNIPRGLGPEPWKLENLLQGVALLISPIEGFPIKASLPPPKEVLNFQKKLVIEREIKLEDHPWIKKLSEKGFSYWKWLEPLERRKWDVVIEHGDFAPWNLICDSDGKIWAIDWEFGDLCGFPYLDIIYYFLQVSALIYKWDPIKAFKVTKEYLQTRFNFDKKIAASLIKLSAFEAYWITSQNGRSDDWPLQKWRRKIWEIEN